MIKLNKKQKKALRNNAKRHARKHGEHRRRIQTILDSSPHAQKLESRWALEMIRWRY